MKLYYFQPDGHGPSSYFVMAESEEAAIVAILKRQAELNKMGYNTHNPFDPKHDKLQIANENEAIDNDNA